MKKILFLSIVLALMGTKAQSEVYVEDIYSGCVGSPSATDEDVGWYLQKCLEFRFPGWTVTGDPDAVQTVPYNVWLVNKVNKIRSEGRYCGDTWYPPTHEVKWNWKLQEASRDHVTDMIEKKYFAHTSPSGMDARQWAYDRGYPYWVQDDLGAGFQPGSDDYILEKWLADPPHCYPIMDERAYDAAAYYEKGYWALYLGWKDTRY